MTRRYFGTDGIRGLSNRFPMTPDLAMRVGIAAGTIFRRAAIATAWLIGKDTRLSGYMLENAMVAGFTAAGLDAFVLGPDPDARRRHADAFAPLRSRRYDFCLPQSLRRQWHQALRP